MRRGHKYQVGDKVLARMSRAGMSERLAYPPELDDVGFAATVVSCKDDAGEPAPYYLIAVVDHIGKDVHIAVNEDGQWGCYEFELEPLGDGPTDEDVARWTAWLLTR